MYNPDTTGNDHQWYQEYQYANGNFLCQYNKICESHNRGFKVMDV